MSDFKKISCNGCGASLIFDPSTQMSSCNFCGTKFEITTAEDTTLAIIPEGVIPFNVNKTQFKNAVFAWLSEGDYTPDDILTSSVFDEINGLYLPQFFYEGKYSGNWSASSGYDRRESYVVIVNNKAQTRYRTVTDWRPSNGQVAGQYSILGFAGQAEKLPPTIAPFMHNCTFASGDLKPFNQQYIQGFNLVPFELDSEIIWNSLGTIQADSIAAADIRKRIPGDRYNHLNYDISYDHTRVTNILSPAYIVHYKYSEKDFHVYMDGSSITRIEGERPVDKQRQNEVHALKKPIRRFWWIFGIISLLFFIWYGDLSYSDQEDFGDGAMFTYILVMTIYGWRSYRKANKAVKAVLDASKKRRQDILKNMQEGLSEPQPQVQTNPTTSNDFTQSDNKPSF